MRCRCAALARELEVSPMALYGYFEAKRDLVRGMVEAVARGLGPQDTGRGRRGRPSWPRWVAASAPPSPPTPGLAQLFVTAPALEGGRAMHVVDDMVAVLRRQGMSGEMAVTRGLRRHGLRDRFRRPRRSRDAIAKRSRTRGWRRSRRCRPERFPNMVEVGGIRLGLRE